MRRGLLVILLLLGFCAAPSQAVLIDYNEGLGPNPSGPFPSVGSYYSALPGHPVHDGFIFIDYSGPSQGFDPIYGPHSPWGLIGAAYPGTGIASISWDIGARDVSFWYGYDEEYGPLEVDAYHNGHLVFSIAALPENNSGGMLQYILPVNQVIDLLVFSGTSNRYSLDDLEYTPVPVPEPSALVSMATVFIALGIAGYVRRKSGRG